MNNSVVLVSSPAVANVTVPLSLLATTGSSIIGPIASHPACIIGSELIPNCTTKLLTIRNIRQSFQKSDVVKYSNRSTPIGAHDECNWIRNLLVALLLRFAIRNSIIRPSGSRSDSVISSTTSCCDSLELSV